MYIHLSNLIDAQVDKIVGLRGERKPSALAVGIANPLE
jgi:hypothetical protein